MNVELVAQMFKNYQSNVLFHLEGQTDLPFFVVLCLTANSNSDLEGSHMRHQ